MARRFRKEDGELMTRTFAHGSIADGAAWDVPLTGDEIAALAAGVCPTLIRPDRLKYFCPHKCGMRPANG